MAENAFAQLAKSGRVLDRVWAIAEPAARTMGIEKICLSKWRPNSRRARTESREKPVTESKSIERSCCGCRRRGTNDR